jgi:hypothetical protein
MGTPLVDILKWDRTAEKRGIHGARPLVGAHLMIRISCPRCRSILECADYKSGSKIACPKCKDQEDVKFLIGKADIQLLLRGVLRIVK